MSFTNLKNKRRRLLLSLLSSQSVTYGNEPHKSKFRVLFQEVTGRIVPCSSDVACTQTLFYFSFRSFRKHRRAREGERKSEKEK